MANLPLNANRHLRFQKCLPTEYSQSDCMLAESRPDVNTKSAALIFTSVSLDRLVYALYGLTEEEEIAIVEEAGGQKSEAGGRKKGGKQILLRQGSGGQEAVAEPDSGGQEAEVAASVGCPASGVPKKKPAPRKLKANLPPSLPGWD